MSAHILRIFGKLSAMLLVLPAIAAADDFTFDIPVRLSNMHPDIVQGKVECAVSDSTTSGFAPVQVGRNDTAFVLRDGGFNGDVTVVVNAANERIRARARSWGCALYLRAHDERGFRRAYHYAGGGPTPRYPRDRSAPFRDDDSGALPR